MNEANTQKLYADFPLMYLDALAGKGCMAYGIACGDGWFDLIYKLSADVDAEAKKLGLDQARDAWPRVLQIKEKFGRLCFYLSAGEDSDEGNFSAEVVGQIVSLRPVPNIASIHKLCRDAEKQSLTICEGCGCSATLRDDGWMRVLCDKCEAERQKRKAAGIS